MLKKELKRKLCTFDKIYWGCVRPLCVEMYTSLCKEVFLSKKSNILLDELIKQFKKIQKKAKFTLSNKTKEYLKNFIVKFIKKNKSKYEKLGYFITFKNNNFFISYSNNYDCFIIVSTRPLRNTGLTELYERDNIMHMMTFTNPLVEFYFNLLSLIFKPLVYTFSDIIYEFDSIYLHEKQHVCEDIQSLFNHKSRSDEAYYKHLKSDSTYHFNKYIQHPVEILANIQQLAYYLHLIRPQGTIDTTRFINFFIRYREYKYACSFKRTELNKFHVLFAPKKKHNVYWYKLLFRLINFKFYQLYKRPILINIGLCLNYLEKILTVK